MKWRGRYANEMKLDLAHTAINRPEMAPYPWLCLDLGYVGLRVYEHVLQTGMVPWVGVTCSPEIVRS